MAPTSLGAVDAVAESSLKAFVVGELKIAVANVGGTFYAFGNTCTHRGCPLARGHLTGTTVTCVCHGSQFDVTSGSVLQGPAEDPVASYPITVEGDELLIDV